MKQASSTPNIVAATARSQAFLKWAGSKRRLLPQLLPLLPAGQRLIEPFVGAGNVFIATDYEEYLLADSNSVLMASFEALKMDTDAFISECAGLFIEASRSPQAFAALRACYNNPDTPLLQRAALFVYINKFGYNGLYRENRQGQCNTPYGHPAQLPTFPELAMRTFAGRLVRATLLCGDFEAVMLQARPGDVVYCDPPYADQESKTSFTAYGKQGFDWNDHVRLEMAARQLAAQGIPVVISNHDTAATRELYAGAELHTFQAYRSIAAKAGKRGPAGELVAVFR